MKEENKAGKKIKNTNLTSEELEEETRVINNWRAAYESNVRRFGGHSYRSDTGALLYVPETDGVRIFG